VWHNVAAYKCSPIWIWIWKKLTHITGYPYSTSAQIPRSLFDLDEDCKAIPFAFQKGNQLSNKQDHVTDSQHDQGVYNKHMPNHNAWQSIQVYFCFVIPHPNGAHT
jgi:hypothetical protein